MTHRHRHRVGAAAGVGALILMSGMFAAAPVQADSGAKGGVQIFVEDPWQLPSPNGQSHEVSFWYVGAVAPSHDVVLTADLSGVAGFARSADPACSGTLCRFDEGTVNPPGPNDDDRDTAVEQRLELEVLPGVAPGQKGTVKISGTSSDGSVSTYDVPVSYGRPDLVVDSGPVADRPGPGTTVRVPIEIANNGDVAAQGVRLTLDTTQEAALPSYTDCAVKAIKPDPDGGTWPREHETVCDLPTVLEAGHKYRLSMPLAVGLSARSLVEELTYQVAPLDVTPQPTAGHAMTLVPDGTGPGAGQAKGSREIDVASAADLGVDGDTVTGRPGGTVEFTVTLFNRGPGSVFPERAYEYAEATVHVPKGTTVVGEPRWCTAIGPDGRGLPVKKQLGAPAYKCVTHTAGIAAGYEQPNTFTLRIAANAPATTTGSVTLDKDVPTGYTAQTNPADDTSSVTVHVLPARPAGGTTGNAAGGPSAGGSLADTGFPGWGTAAVAAALITAGAGALATTRRRHKSI